MRYKINWFSHYQRKLVSLNIEKNDLIKIQKQDKCFIDEILHWNPKSVLEVGCGLARTSLVLASLGLSVSALDTDRHLLRTAEENQRRLGLHLDLIQGNFFQLPQKIKKQFDLCFHSGVLEHFSDGDIREILKMQLKIAPIIVFTIPIYSIANVKYFNDKDKIYRRLLSIKQWKKILSCFDVVKMKNVKTRHDDLLITITKK